MHRQACAPAGRGAGVDTKEKRNRRLIDAPVTQAQRHINEPYSKLSQLRTTYDGHRMFIIVTHAWGESNGTLPQFARDPRPAERILQMDGDVGKRSHHWKKTAYEILRSDWSSDVCSSDLSSVRLRVDVTSYDTDPDLSQVSP